MLLALITKKAIPDALDASLDDHLWLEKIKSDDEDTEKVEYLPPLCDAAEYVPKKDWDKLFNENSDSNFYKF